MWNMKKQSKKIKQNQTNPRNMTAELRLCKGRVGDGEKRQEGI